MPIRQRNIAYKLWISQLFSGDYVHSQDDYVPSHLNLNGLNIVRVNIIANITLTNILDSYASAIADDGSAAIRIKTWQQDANLIKSINPGDIALIIGKIREYNNERYISPDFIKKIDNPNWLLVRQLELLKQYQSTKNTLQPMVQVIQEERTDNQIVKPSIGARNKIINVIESITSADGVTIDEILAYSKLPKNEVEATILELVKEGELYYHKPGRLKLLQ